MMYYNNHFHFFQLGAHFDVKQNLNLFAAKCQVDLDTVYYKVRQDWYVEDGHLIY